MANDDFPIDTAQMVAVFMESVFYGYVPITIYYFKRLTLLARNSEVATLNYSKCL